MKKNLLLFTLLATLVIPGCGFQAPKKTLDHISITTKPEKLNYIVGETFDTTGMVVEATYSDSSTKTITDYTYTPNGPLTLDDTTVYVKYIEDNISKLDTVNISVSEVVTNLVSITISKLPNKLVYTEGDALDLAGLEVKANYSDGTSKIVNNYTCDKHGTLTVNDTLITISYTEKGATKTASFSITVAKKDVFLSSIKVITKPKKLEYREGETLDLTGMVVQATYSDGSVANINNYTYEPKRPLQLTDNRVTISYEEKSVVKSDSFTISVLEKVTLLNISIDTLPSQTVYYEGELLNLSGLSVSANYSDKSSKTVTNYTFTPNRPLVKSDTEVVISYTEGDITVQNSFNITVKEKEVDVVLERIAVITKPSKLTYVENEELDLSGIVVHAFYSNDTFRQITNFDYTPKGKLSLSDTIVTIFYSEDGVNAQTTFDIVVNPYQPIVETPFNNVPSVIEGKVGGTYQFFPIAKEGYYTNNNFRYVCNEGKDVVGVDKNGYVDFYFAGQENIILYSDDNFNNIKDPEENYMTVKFVISESTNIIEPDSIYIESMSIESFPGATYPLSCQVVPVNATYRKIRYYSEDEDVATVDETGMVFIHSIGLTKVICYIDKNNNRSFDKDEFSTFTFVGSVDNKGASIVLPEYETTIRVGESKTIKTTNIPSGSVYYSAYAVDESVCLSAGGNNSFGITGVAPGTTTVRVWSQTFMAESDLIVNVLPKEGNVASKININSSDFALDVGDSKTITCNLSPSNSDDDISFTSNNPMVATIDENGLINAVSSGSVRITAKASSSQYLEDSIVVTVKGNTTYDPENYYDNYYGDLQWTDSVDLEKKLFDILRDGYNPLKYNSPTNWETNMYADADVDDDSYIDLIYTTEKPLNVADKNVWQREHCLCASLMCGITTGEAVNSLGRGTDFQNLIAAGSSGNQSRSNKNMGYANKQHPGYSDKGNYSYDRTNFEPLDKDKGRVARAALYMSVMHGCEEDANLSEKWTFLSPSDISAHGSSKSKTAKYNITYKPINFAYNVVKYEGKLNITAFLGQGTGASTSTYAPAVSYKALHDYYCSLVDGQEKDSYSDDTRIKAYALYSRDFMSYSMGNLNDLLEWTTFPVSRVEIQHCESVYSHIYSGDHKAQGNRNPLIDYPELVAYLFGCLKDTPGKISLLKPSIVK